MTRLWTEEDTKALGDALKEVGGEKRSRNEAFWLTEARRVQNRAENAGIKIDLPSHDTYPTRCLGGFVHPPVLFRKGPPVFPSLAVAVVGSRDADRYGLAAAAAFTAAFVSGNIAIVSGGARGVDAAAHRAALDGGGRTIAVLAGGLDRPSPASSRSLFIDMVRHGGTLISESPPGVRPRPHFFPHRNRLIAALSDAVVVIQAALRSGSAHTAVAARAQGKPLFAVPGDLCYRQSEGVNAMIASGSAQMATCPADVLGALSSGDVCHQEKVAPKWPKCGDRVWPLPLSWGAGKRKLIPIELSSQERVLLEVLAQGPAAPSEIAVRCMLSVQQIMVALGRLELAGWICRMPGNRYILVNKEKITG